MAHAPRAGRNGDDDRPEHYVTIFDGTFLPQVLALHRSLERHSRTFVLWAICVDHLAYDALTAFRFDSLRPIAVSDIETDSLRTARVERSRAEYCWTLTPVAPRVVFDLDSSVERVTYIDADMYALADPSPIFDDFDSSGKAVMITEHDYAPEYDQTATSGRFCVQFVTFQRSDSEPVRSWWEERCIEWCYARYEDGKFGDQKYLDQWPTLFSDSVHVLGRKGLILAPWNAVRFPFSEAVFYHFHKLRTTRYFSFEFGSYHLPKPVLKDVYAPYIRELKDIHRALADAGIPVRPQLTAPSLGRRLKRLVAAYRRC